MKSIEDKARILCKSPQNSASPCARLETMRGLVVLPLFALLCVVPVANAQGFGRKKEIVPALKEDIKYIQCQFCEIAAKHLQRSVGDLRRDAPSWRKISENDILEHLEAACKADKKEGEWLLKLDVQEQGDELLIKEMSKVRTASLE